MGPLVLLALAMSHVVSRALALLVEKFALSVERPGASERLVIHVKITAGEPCVSALGIPKCLNYVHENKYGPTVGVGPDDTMGRERGVRDQGQSDSSGVGAARMQDRRDSRQLTVISISLGLSPASGGKLHGDPATDASTCSSARGWRVKCGAESNWGIWRRLSGSSAELQHVPVRQIQKWARAVKAGWTRRLVVALDSIPLVDDEWRHVLIRSTLALSHWDPGPTTANYRAHPW